jgi:hypothetical protein
VQASSNRTVYMMKQTINQKVMVKEVNENENAARDW